MEKKYQVFISSTYLDLKEERQAISRAVLDLGHIPSGMELFPATNASQMEYIRRVIDDCDYYVIVLGGRYGSVGSDGLSYTEQEYNYAVQTGQPILAFVHEDIGELKAKNTEADENLRAKLSAFRQRVQSSRVVKQWSDIASLQASVITSLVSEFSSNPRIGWRRDDNRISGEALEKLDKLTRDVEYYRSEWWTQRSRILSYEDLSQSVAEVKYDVKGALRKTTVSGEQIIREFAPALRGGLLSRDVRSGLKSIIAHATQTPEENILVRDESIETIFLFFEVFEIGLRSLSGTLKFNEEKTYLLKAAFQPLSKVISDEIPF